MPNYGLLARQGRREDNAAMGGQVAHISAVESELLRLLGGAGTTNPATGLPEYYTAASFGGTATFGGPGQSAAYGGYGPGGQAGGPGTSGHVGLTGASNVYGPPTTQQVAKLAQTKAIAKAKAKAEGKTNWADAVLSGDMATITKLGKDAYVKNAFDNFMDGIFVPLGKFIIATSPTVQALKYGAEALAKIFGEGTGVSDGGDGQTQTATDGQTQTATYGPLGPHGFTGITGSIRTPTLAQAIAEPTPEEETEVAEGELFDLGFPESPLIKGQKVFDAELARTISPENLAQYDLATQDVLIKYVAAQLLQQAQTQGQLA
jgi:hypothetical protein